jgi:hypothetical protein
VRGVKGGIKVGLISCSFGGQVARQHRVARREELGKGRIPRRKTSNVPYPKSQHSGAKGVTKCVKSP